MQQVFISHTTRDQRDLNLAHKIAHGLNLLGIKTWIAPDNIPSGEEWEQKLIRGLLEQATHFLVILSAASIQAEWVLKEIEMARARYEGDPGFVIFPLVTGDLGEYPHNEFMGKFQYVNYDDNLRVIMEQLAKALGLRPTILTNFTTRIDELTQDFVGREYVFSSIQAFLSQHSKGYFLLEGDPGVGKSAIMAELVSRTGYISHFIFQAQGTNTSQHFLESICTQLIHRYDLPYTELPQEATRDGTFLNQLLHEAAEQLSPGENLVVVVDALDELDQSSIRPGENVLYLPASLPDNTFFILSSRPVPITLNTTLPVELYDLMQRVAESRADVEAYLAGAVSDHPVQDWMLRNKISEQEFIRVLADKSENNFMYLKYVLGDVRSNRFHDLSVVDLPQGLKRYYEIHWQRMGMMQKPLPEDRIKIVYVLCEVGQPVSRALIADFAQQEELLVQSVLDDWEQFLREHQEEGEKRYSLYHTSFRDFLHRKDIVQAAGLTIEGIHALIADNLLQTWESIQDED